MGLGYIHTHRRHHILAAAAAAAVGGSQSFATTVDQIRR